MKGWFTTLAKAFLLAATLVTIAGIPTALAQTADSYTIGPDDVLTISVWLRPELERTVTVNNQGNITFPPVGEVKASGLTAKQLSDRLTDRLSTYLRQTTTVTVAVTQFLSHSVFVSGAVARPGRYGFESIPSLLDVMSQAGGALPGADLSRVQITRKEGATLRTIPADLSTALQLGTAESLPKLQSGDVVMVPSSTAGGALTADAVGVLGAVQRPGLYAVGDGQDLWMVLAQAGGPTAAGDLKSIRVITKDQKNVHSAIRVNLKNSLDRGNRSPFIIKPGDIVYMNAKGGGAWSAFLQVMSVTRDVANIVALVKVLNE